MLRRNGMEFKNSEEYNTWLVGELRLIALNTENIYNLLIEGKLYRAYQASKKEIEKIGYKVYSNDKIMNSFKDEFKGGL